MSGILREAQGGGGVKAVCQAHRNPHAPRAAPTASLITRRVMPTVRPTDHGPCPASLTTHSAHSSSACANTVFTASSCKSGEPKDQGD